MRRFIFIFLSLSFCFFNLNSAFGFNIVYPGKEKVTINSPRTFFIGNENPEKFLYINNEKVELYRTGGFKHSVELDYGKNKFIIKNDAGKEVEYVIYRPEQVNVPIVVKRNVFTPSIYGYTTDKTILRVSPVDRGLNRLQQLPSGILLEIIGEYGDFYDVRLGRDDNAWIAKNQIILSEENDLSGEIFDKIIEEKDNKVILKVFTDRKLPYYISENEGLDLYLFNVKNAPFYRYEDSLPQNKLFGYTSYYTEDNVLVIEMKKPPVINKTKPLKNIKIVIDPGHGGKETGTIGCLGTKEKEINLLLAQKLKSRLNDEGANVYLTRDDDEYVDLYDRVDFANNLGADIFISIHNNALSDSLANKDISGTEVYYFYPQAKPLAKAIMNGINQFANTKNNGIKGESFAVIRNSNAVSVLLEVAYMINPEEDEKLSTPEFQDAVIEGIIKGLENYINDIQK